MLNTTDTINIKITKEITAIVKKSSYFEENFLHTKKLDYTNFFTNKMLMIAVINEGVPYSLFSLIQYITPFTNEHWASFLDLSTKSLLRYKQTAKNFRPLQSEKIIEIAEVTNLGIDVFSNKEKFNTWLTTPNYALGNSTPITLLKHSYGKELVIAELTNINYGIFA